MSVTITVDVEQPTRPLVPVAHVQSHDIACDFVGGWAFGNALGVGMRSLDGWWTVDSVAIAGGSSEVRTETVRGRNVLTRLDRVSNCPCYRARA